MSNRFELSGVVYEAVPELGGVSACAGCAGDGNSGLCHALPNCSEDRVIWVQSAPVTAPTFPKAVAGRKDDTSKLDVTLLFDDLPHALEAVTEVMQWAITKKQPTAYVRGSWQGVPGGERRYRAAQLRHELNRAKSVLAGRDTVDHETGLEELAHIATDALFRLEQACRKKAGIDVGEWNDV